MATAARIGRPTKSTPERAHRLVELVGAGASTAAAARALGVDPQTLVNWRARAWSREPRDQPFVALERRLLEAERHRQGQPTWEATAALLEGLAPERWGLPER